MKRKDLRDKFKSEFSIIQNAVNLFDPYGLIKGGAPIDEYDSLTYLILSGLNKNLSKDALIDSLLSKLGKDFDLFDDPINIGELRNRTEKFITALHDKLKKPNC